ncbi:hypothetical protein [Saccharothrix sp. Mg75]|uniref:hypothetical protein n=1 Tax=Saccharothrix sp. Mg75 TaxID=3445357 RepID=UPI003EF03FD2
MVVGDDESIGTLEGHVDVLGRVVGIVTSWIEGAVDPLGRQCTSQEAGRADSHTDRHMAPGTGTEALRRAATAASGAVDIIVAAADRYGSRHQIDDAQHLRSRHEQLRRHGDVLDRLADVLTDGDVRSHHDLRSKVGSIAPLLTEFHQAAERLYFSLEHRLALLTAHSENRPGADGHSSPN